MEIRKCEHCILVLLPIFHVTVSKLLIFSVTQFLYLKSENYICPTLLQGILMTNSINDCESIMKNVEHM